MCYTKSMESKDKNGIQRTETVTISREEYEAFLAQKRKIAVLEEQVQLLMERMRLTRKQQFGSSSEQSKYEASPEQLNLFNEAEYFADETVPEPEMVAVEKHYRKKRAELKEQLPEDLPVEVIEHTLPEEEQICPQCGEHLHVMGKEVFKKLKIIPAQVIVEEHVCYTYSCRHCEQHDVNVPVMKAPVPEPVIKGSFATPEAVAHIMTQKFVMGSPLYRQEQELSRAGIPLSRQTMSNWVLRCSTDWLKPVYARLHEELLKHTSLHADETTLQVLREDGKKAQAKSYMWLYRTSGDTQQSIVLYDYRPDRKAENAKTFLQGFTGYLHADGYSGYHKLPDNITVVGCWAHARRKFDEALNGLPEKDRTGSEALTGKQYCDDLFKIEEAIKGESAANRKEVRQKQAQPVLDAFKAWLETSKAAPKSLTGKAVNYAREQWTYLIRYIEDGRLEISNNRAERSIKPFVIGRKNFLFANTPRGAEGSAVIYSIIETAKENWLDPYRYLGYILRTAPNLHLPDDPEQLDKLLPWNAPAECRIPTRPAEA